ncbi:hypothetical protein LRZ95_00800, partial [Candidatus Gracilibacteria bacterium]|nr:hypothetical protein [Candidatus Gracilibacteria bacterium]
IKKEGTDEYITRIVGDYDSESCFDDKDKCPETLIGSGTTILIDKQKITSSDTTNPNQGIPYPVNGF